MRVVLMILLTLSAVAAWPSATRVVSACGDKALTVGRGLRYNRAYAAIHPGTVLLYSRSGAAAFGPQLDSQLKRAGHTVIVVSAAPALREALKSTAVDVILASLSDAEAVEVDAAVASSHPSLVCVKAVNETAPVQPDLKRACRLKASDQPNKFLTEIDEVMKARVEASRKSASR
jgi:hypothetical protein